MSGQKQWEVTPYPGPLPPPYRKMAGRPSKMKRVKEKGEAQEKQQVKRAKRQNKCSRCGGLGHYRTKCSNPIPNVVGTSVPAEVNVVATADVPISSSAPQPFTQSQR